MITAQSTTILNIKSYLSQHILASKKKHCQSRLMMMEEKKRSSSIQEKKLAIGRHPVMARHFVLSIKIWAGLAVQGWTQEFPVEYIVYNSIYTDYTQLTIQLTAAAYILVGPQWRCVCVLCCVFQLLLLGVVEILCAIPRIPLALEAFHTTQPRTPILDPRDPQGPLFQLTRQDFLKLIL